MAGIYVHIPFCARRCIYCGFFSTTRETEAARYVNALCRELEQRHDYLQGAPVTTLYFGGGTPSRLTPDQIGQVIDCIRAVFGLGNLIELTVECNPDDITPDYIAALSESGVNRISMGVQTFNDDLLRFLGRRHTSKQAVDAVGICRQSGIQNISIDLMYGLPGQTPDIQRHDLRIATDLAVQHISSYCLSYEDDSPLDNLRKHNRITPADDETCATMYDQMCAHLHSSGFEHYEISNFCRPGFHSRHNSSYWDGTPYIGIGAAAHSYDIESRSWNIADIKQYIQGMANNQRIYEEERLDCDTRYNDAITVALRTSRGLDLQALSPKHRTYCLENAQRYLDDGLLERTQGNRLRLTRRGLFVSDMIMSNLIYLP